MTGRTRLGKARWYPKKKKGRRQRRRQKRNHYSCKENQISPFIESVNFVTIFWILDSSLLAKLKGLRTTWFWFTITIIITTLKIKVDVFIIISNYIGLRLRNIKFMKLSEFYKICMKVCGGNISWALVSYCEVKQSINQIHSNFALGLVKNWSDYSFAWECCLKVTKWFLLWPFSIYN